MSSHAVACPHCHAALRSARPLPHNKKLRCPQCGASFKTAPPVSPEPADPRQLVSPPPLPWLSAPPPLPAVPAFSAPARSPTAPGLWLPALIGGLLLLGGIAAVAVVLTLFRPEPAPAAAEPKNNRNDDEDQRLAEEQRLAEQRQQLDEERRKLDADRKRVAFDRLMSQAATALAQKRYEEARQAYSEALKLRPDDPDAVKGLADARTPTQAEPVTETKPPDDGQEKRKAEIARLLEQGKAAMAKKEYAAAVQAFQQARELDAGSAEARKGLQEATAAAAATDADAAEMKKRADYKTHLAAGRAAMKAQRFEEAVREFQAALKIVPDDTTAAINLQTAKNQVAAAPEEKKGQAAHADLMRRARAALAANRPDKAVSLLESALRLLPQDQDTQKALQEAKQAAATARAEYGRLLELGDAALNRGQFDEAQRQYEQATQVLPGEPTAAAKIQAVVAARAKQAALAVYQRFMARAAIDMQNQRFAAAARNFQEALRAVPGDANATQGLRDAQAGIEQAVRLRADFDKLMLKGATAMRQRQYGEAVQAYTAALKLVPGDPRATQGLTQARYDRAMLQGRAALASNRQQDAIRWFEEALQVMPGDPTAATLLQQARIRRKP